MVEVNFIRNMNQDKTIIWDWNGTLLNDVEINLKIVNEMLSENSMHSITKDYYKATFTFPIRLFYQALGFNMQNESDYNLLISTYNRKYQQRMNAIPLHKNAEDTLQMLSYLHINQIILSGQNQTNLNKQVEFYGITQYFSLVIGSATNDATDKINRLSYILDYQKIKTDNIIIVGDTVSDWMLASRIGCTCALLSHGHQSEGVLLRTGAKIFPCFSENFVEFLCK